jgi:hypothetical protein
MIFSYHISGDWGRPSASIVCRFPRNLWERDTVLAGSVFTLFWDIQLSCCLFHDSGAWGSIPQQAMRGVITGFRGNELPCLLDLIFAPFGASLFPSHLARYFCSLVVQGIASVLAKISVGVIGAKLLSSYVSQHSIFRNCNAEIPSLLGKLLLLCREAQLSLFSDIFLYIK